MTPGELMKGIIFDMDGTLISTEELIVHCVNQTSKKYLKRTLPREDELWTFGPPARNIIKTFASKLPGRPVREAVEDYHSCYRTNFLERALLIPEVPELLQKLRSSGKRLAVVTVEERALMEHDLETYGLKKYFDIMISRDDVDKPKPDPEGLRSAMRGMNTNAQDSMMVGDSATDIMSGKNAGMLTGLAIWAPQFKGNFDNIAPDYEFRSVQELASFLSGTD